MTKLQKTFIVLFLTFMTSCATTTFKDYQQGTATEDQFQRESAGCEMEAEKSLTQIPAESLYRTSHYNRIFDTCMRSKGYKNK